LGARFAFSFCGDEYATRYVVMNMRQDTLPRLLSCLLVGLLSQVLLVNRLVASERLTESGALVLIATLDDEAITPGTAKYLDRAIRAAQERQAECLVITLDTPGGLLTSTRLLTKRMMTSETPIVVYVAPSGSRATSAGVFLVLASHVAAMAPSTTIGAAHPVQIGGLPIGPEPHRTRGQDVEGSDGDVAPSKRTTSKQDESSDRPPQATPVTRSSLEEKIVNDTVAWARALADYRGRNTEWAANAVEQSVSITASEAVENGVVELMADDLDDLLRKLQGREVSTSSGTQRLNTAGARVEPVEIWWGERVLTLIASPNVAFLLLMFGFYGILFELYSPGWGISGTVGGVCMVLGLFGLAVLPVNYLGLVLIAIALALMAAEVFVTSYGALVIAGAACLVVGGIMLVDSPDGFSRVSLSVVLPVSTATAVITLVLVTGIVRSFRMPVQTGSEVMVTQAARVVEDFTVRDGAFHGTVAIHGERWRAISEQPLQSDELCHVTARAGLTLMVKPKQTEAG
jgi:membrane-bound serine protease (ClpP class)